MKKMKIKEKNFLLKTEKNKLLKMLNFSKT